MALPKFETLDAVTSYTWPFQPALGSDDPTETARRVIDTVEQNRGGVPINSYSLATRKVWRFLFTYKTLSALDDFLDFADERIFYFYPDSALTPKYKVRWVAGAFNLQRQAGGTYNLDMTIEEM